MLSQVGSFSLYSLSRFTRDTMQHIWRLVNRSHFFILGFCLFIDFYWLAPLFCFCFIGASCNTNATSFITRVSLLEHASHHAKLNHVDSLLLSSILIEIFETKKRVWIFYILKLQRVRWLWNQHIKGWHHSQITWTEFNMFLLLLWTFMQYWVYTNSGWTRIKWCGWC